MIQDEYNFLFGKFIDNDITEKQLSKLEELASQNPEFKKEYDQYKSVIQGIKSSE